MPTKAALDAVNTIHKALENLKPDDQVKALVAAITLLGIAPSAIGLPDQSGNDSSASQPGTRAGNPSGSTAAGTASDFFRKKDPQGLMEALAVAARYRELTERADAHTKEQLDAVFRNARRDAPANFSRDLANAKQQQYFNRGKEIVLSHFGQAYVDVLPNRETARAIARPKKAGGKRKGKAAAK